MTTLQARQRVDCIRFPEYHIRSYYIKCQLLWVMCTNGENPGDEDEETAPAEPRLIFGDCYQPGGGENGVDWGPMPSKKSL